MAFFSRMDLSGLRVHLAGMWMDLPEDSPLRDWAVTGHDDCVDNDEVAAIYRRAKCGVNVYRREAEGAGRAHACLPAGTGGQARDQVRGPGGGGDPHRGQPGGEGGPAWHAHPCTVAITRPGLHPPAGVASPGPLARTAQR